MNAAQNREVLLSEALAFIRARTEWERERREPRCTGRSSNALAEYALGWRERPYTPGTPNSKGGSTWLNDECGDSYPSDRGDLRACELTYLLAPKWMRDRMLPVLQEFRDFVLEGKNRYGEVLWPKEGAA